MSYVSLISKIILLFIGLLTIQVHSFSLSSSTCRHNSCSSKGRNFVMKKGRGVPINQRGEFMKQQRLMEMQAKMKLNKPEGVPIFKIFVRLRSGGIWLPCGDLAGDQRSTALVNAWTSGFLTDLYKGQLDRGVAKSIFSQEDSFSQNIITNFKPFAKAKKEDMQFGYKVEFPGIEDKLGPQTTTLLVKGMEKGFIDNLKDGFSNLFSEYNQDNETQ